MNQKGRNLIVSARRTMRIAHKLTSLRQYFPGILL